MAARTMLPGWYLALIPLDNQIAAHADKAARCGGVSLHQKFRVASRTEAAAATLRVPKRSWQVTASFIVRHDERPGDQLMCGSTATAISTVPPWIWTDLLSLDSFPPLVYN
jgi:hypothetical protein